MHRMSKQELNMLKAWCEKAKIEIQKTKQDYTFDFSVFGDRVKKQSFSLSTKTRTQT